MTPEVYCSAYEKANSELSEIFAQFDQLGLRKGQIERLLETLKPLVGAESSSEPIYSSERLSSDPGHRRTEIYKSHWEQPEGALSVV
jgi:hypothetical protein